MIKRNFFYRNMVVNKWKINDKKKVRILLFDIFNKIIDLGYVFSIGVILR